MEKRHLIKKRLEMRLKERYKPFTGEAFDERPHFEFNHFIFRLDTIGAEFNGIVVEYAYNEKQVANNCFEDGDCFNVDDLSEEQIYNAVISEIEDQAD